MRIPVTLDNECENFVFAQSQSDGTEILWIGRTCLCTGFEDEPDDSLLPHSGNMTSHQAGVVQLQYIKQSGERDSTSEWCKECHLKGLEMIHSNILSGFEPAHQGRLFHDGKGH